MSGNPYAPIDLSAVYPSVAPPTAAPPVAIDPGSAQLGSGLSMPTQSAPAPATSQGPTAMQSSLSPAALRDVIAGQRSINATVSNADESRRRERAGELERMGATPTTSPTTQPSPLASSAGVANPYATRPAAGASSAGAAASHDYYALGQAPAGRIGKEYDAATKAESSAEERLEHAQGVAANLQADIQRRHAEGMMGAEQAYSAGAAQAAQDRTAHEAENKAHLDKIQMAQDDLAKDKIDPDHIYGDHKTAGKLLAGLGSILGSIGASYGHHENYAQKMIDDSITRDIEVQKGNHATKAAGVQGQINMYDRHRQEGLDHEAAEAATRSDLYAHTLRQGDALAEKSGSNSVKQAWNVQRAGLAEKAAQAQQQTAIEVNRLGWQTTQRAGAGPSKIDDAVAKVDLENQDTAAAAGRLAHAPEGDLAGYGTGGRLRHWLSDKTGMDLESDEAKANRRDVETLESRRLKEEGSRVNTNELERKGRLTRNEADVRGLSADEIRRELLERDQAKRGLTSGGGNRSKAPAGGPAE